MIVLKRGRAEIIVLWVMFAILAATGIGLLWVAFSLRGNGAAGGALVLTLTAGAMALIGLYLLEDALARGGVRIAIGANAAELALPERRGHVRYPAVYESVPRAALTGIESRTETFSNAAEQTTYALVLADGRRLILGADKQMLAPFFHNAAQTLAREWSLEIRHLGVVKAKTGFMLMWGAAVPPWDSEVLGAAEAEKTLRHTQNFLVYVRLLILAALALSAAAQAMG
ncbi:MAG TPA: hypothetical protein PLK37_00780 [Terricaulis sp.]|nr:hypothetical protein [Terricaulis sp.]